MACCPDRRDRHLVGVGSPRVYAALFMLHRTGDGTGAGGLHRRTGRHAMGCAGYRPGLGKLYEGT